MHLLLAIATFVGAASVCFNHVMTKVQKITFCQKLKIWKVLSHQWSHLQAMPMVYYPAQYIPADEVLVRVPRQLAQGNSACSLLSQICSWWNTFVTISSPQGPLRPVRQSDFAADQEASADTAYGAAPVTCNILHLRHHDSIELNMLICLESDHWVDILLRLLDVFCHSIKLKLKQLQQLCHGKRN